MLMKTRAIPYQPAIKDPWLHLCLAVIQTAQEDVVKANQAGRIPRQNYETAKAFFTSPLYQTMLDYIACFVPELRHTETLLPKGVDLK